MKPNLKGKPLIPGKPCNHHCMTEEHSGSRMGPVWKRVKNGEGSHFLPNLPKLNTPSSPNPSVRDATTDSLEIAIVGGLTPCGLAHATN